MDEISAKVPTPSPRLAGLPGYGRGRAGAAQIFAHRLGSNEAPDAPDRAERQAVAAAIDGANRYPDLRGETLGAALALRHGLKADQVAVAAGSIVLLDQLMRAYCDGGDEIVTAWRSYEAYPILAGDRCAVGQTGALGCADHGGEVRTPGGVGQAWVVQGLSA